MTENTATPITQAQVDFVKKTMSERGLDVSNIPDPNEGETVEEWFDRSIAQYNEVAQNNDLSAHAYPYGFMTYVADNANLSASFLSTMKPFVVNDFASMPDEQQVAFLRQQIDENIKPEEHGVNPFRSMSTDGDDLDSWTDRFMQCMRDESLSFGDFENSENIFVRHGIYALHHGWGLSYEDIARRSDFDIDENKYNDRMKTQQLCAMACDVAKESINFPEYEEPVVEKPLGMATTSKDHRDRIDQWMEYLGKADQAQALVDKYGVEVAYKICQQSMLAPADLKDVTGGTSLSSKNAVQYFLDNEVSADNLAKIPGLNAEIVEASLQSVRPEPEIARVEPIGLTPLPDPGVELKTPQPTAEQTSLDEQKVLLAATLKNDLQLANIPQDRVDLAIDMAFARSLESGANNFGEWAFNFRQDLIQNLGGEKAFERNEADYNQLCTTFAEAQTAVATGDVPDDVSARTASFEDMVERNNLHLDLAGMGPSTPILTSETYRQTIRFNNQMERRAERDAKRAERDAKRAEELGITVEQLYQRREQRKENWNNFVDNINPFNDREH